MAKTDHNHSIFFRHDGLIDLPTVPQMLKHVRHFESFPWRRSDNRSIAKFLYVFLEELMVKILLILVENWCFLSGDVSSTLMNKMAETGYPTMQTFLR